MGSESSTEMIPALATSASYIQGTDCDQPSIPPQESSIVILLFAFVFLLNPL